MTAYLNGSFIEIPCDVEEKTSAQIPITDRGFLLGDGIFDTMAAHNGEILYATKHIERLFSNARILNIPLHLNNAALRKIAKTLLQQNKIETGYVSIRTTITRGTGPRGLAPPVPDKTQPTILMTATPFDPAAFEKPARAIIAQSVRRNEGSPLSRIKSLNYGDNILAQMEAQEKGADTALMMNNAGHVCCATNGNIFMEENGQLYTPPLSDGVLNGVIRGKIMEQHKVIKESLTPERLLNADALWITNSIIAQRPLQLL